jgi:signal transduction histidine kinase
LNATFERLQRSFEQSVRFSADASHQLKTPVANNGEPIPPDRMPHIFERFYRAHGDQCSAGHGLGLSLARELAVVHGGELILVRSDSEWTEFQMRLPRSL